MREVIKPRCRWCSLDDHKSWVGPVVHADVRRALPGAGLLVSDATQQSGPAFVQDAMLYTVENFLGWVATTEAVCEALVLDSDDARRRPVHTL